MNELEQRIYNSAKIIMTAELRCKIAKDYHPRYVQIPFECDGVINFLIFDRQLNDFTKIKYSKGMGNGTMIGNKNTGYFKDVEHKEFSITE